MTTLQHSAFCKCGAMLFAALVLSSALIAQTNVPADAKKPDRDPETIVLSPFQVTSEGDEGYRATSTLAGTRLRTDLRDVAASVSVVTRDFMKDVGANDLETLLNYTVGTEATGASGNLSGSEAQTAFVEFSTVMRDPAPRTRIRGLSSADTTRDYFLTDVPLDGYITDRIDINRGANAMLFGLGSPSGVINNGLIKARTNRNATEVTAQFGRFGSHRETLDHNHVLLKDRLALRLATLYGERKYQQEHTFSRDKRAFGTATFTPFRGTTVRLNSEFARRDENRPWSTPPFDLFTYWWAMGKPTWDGSTNTGALLGTPASPLLAAISPTGVRNTNLTSLGLGQFFNGGALGVFYEDPRSGVSGISGQPAGTNATESINERLLPGGITSGFHQIRQSQIYNRYANGGTDSPLSNFWRDHQITDPGIFDFYNRKLDGPSKHEWAEWRTHNITLEQAFLNGIAGLELALDKQDLDSGYRQPVHSRNYAINLDINTRLPNGSPNPNFGRPFTQGAGFTGSSGSKREAVRVTGFVDFEPRKYFQNRLARFLGRHVLTLNHTDQRRENYDNFAGSPTIVGLDYAAADNIGIGTSGRRSLSRIVYLGPSLVNAASAQNARLSSADAGQYAQPLSSVNALFYPQPASGTTPAAYQYRTFSVIENRGELITETTAFTPTRARQNFTSGAAVVQSRWFENNLVSTLGWRFDEVATFSSGTAVVDPVTGASQTAPHILVPLQTLADRQTTFAYGLVAHAPKFVREKLPWGMDLSVNYNESENFRPTTQRYTVYNGPVDAELGLTREYGVRVSLFDGKFELRATRFESSAASATNANFRTILAQLSRLPESIIETNSRGANDDRPAALAAWREWERSPAGQRFARTFGYVAANNPDGSVTINSDPRTDIVVGTSDVVARGLELEAVYNPTRRWRIALNGARQEAVRSNTARDILKFFEEEVTPVWRGPAATLRETPGSSATLGQVATNILVGAQREFLLDGSAAPELRKWRWNAVTRYTFADEGRLKGWGVGGAVRWQDKVSIGYPVIVDPVIGPRYDVTRPFRGPEELTFDGFVSYRRRIYKDRITWSAQLNVRNIGKHDYLIPILAQPDGSIAAWRIGEPMIWTLSNTFRF